MIRDYLDPSCDGNHHADLCIIGAGPAGIAIAKAFVGSRCRVLLLESGGLETERRSQVLNEGTSVGPIHLDPARTRLRAYGGSCRLWGGGCMPLSRLDVEPRPWVPHSGWPIDYEDLEHYCQLALGLCAIEDEAPGRGSAGNGGRRRAGLDPALLVDRPYTQSPVFFGETYRDMLAQSSNVELLLHANLLELVHDASDGRIESARIGNIEGRCGQVHALHYVLAAGGLENPRLLLLSDSAKPAGLGNDHGLVGRYFMDHPRCVAGSLVAGPADRVLRRYTREGKPSTTRTHAEISLSDDAQRRLGVLNGRARPYPVPRPTPPGVQALRDLRASLRAPRATHETDVDCDVLAGLSHGIPTPATPAAPGTEPRGRLALRMALHGTDVAKAAVRRMCGRPSVGSERVDVMAYFEQAPNPDSRVRLGSRLDPLGQRSIEVDWRPTPLDLDSYRVASALFGQQLARYCRARFEPAAWLADKSVLPTFHSTAHHIGTTRMADNARDGVVDRHCRVHGIENLHVAGSSVFPTGGWAFPTLTIVALALRLAERLKPALEISGL